MSDLQEPHSRTAFTLSGSSASSQSREATSDRPETSARLPRPRVTYTAWFVLVASLLIAIAVWIGIDRLHDYANANEWQRTVFTRVDGLVSRLHALEGQAMVPSLAGTDTREGVWMTEQATDLVVARAELDAALTELRRIHPEHAEHVGTAFTTFFESIAELEALAAAGRDEAAHDFDASTVEPAFDALRALVTEELAAHHAGAERAELLARVGTLAALLVGSLAFGILFIHAQRASAMTARLEGEHQGLQAREAELRGALDAARAANQATRQFLTMMSHELRTPLQAITGYAELLLVGPEGALTPDQADDVRTIHRGAKRLADLVKQMLDVSRLDAGQMTFASVPVDLREIIVRVRQDVAPQAAAKGLKLSLDVQRDLPVVMGDTTGIHQVLLNLAGNAVKFTETGEVEITATATQGEVAVAVRDTGIGMSQEELPIIFEEFRQVDHGMTRLYEGAGLGLSIARKITEFMGGRLTVESQTGSGSTFTLHLPSVPINGSALDQPAREIISSRTHRQQAVQPGVTS